jgi:hypothetical protein
MGGGYAVSMYKGTCVQGFWLAQLILEVYTLSWRNKLRERPCVAAFYRSSRCKLQVCQQQGPYFRNPQRQGTEINGGMSSVVATQIVRRCQRLFV